MKFYVCKTNMGTSFDCVLTLHEARDLVRNVSPLGSVDMVEVPVTAQAIQCLLGEKGGYATEIKLAYQDK